MTNKKPNKSCPFCEFDVSTEIYYYNKWKNIIICRDKRDLGFKYRLLAVRVGKKNHKALPTGEEREELLKPLIAIAEAQVRNGQANGYTIDEIVNSDHYHYQCNIKRKEVNECRL